MRILPIGVVSKNDIGERTMLDSIPSWRKTDAFRPAYVIAKAAKRTKKAWTKPSAV